MLTKMVVGVGAIETWGYRKKLQQVPLAPQKAVVLEIKKQILEERSAVELHFLQGMGVFPLHVRRRNLL